MIDPSGTLLMPTGFCSGKREQRAYDWENCSSAQEGRSQTTARPPSRAPGLDAEVRRTDTSASGH